MAESESPLEVVCEGPGAWDRSHPSLCTRTRDLREGARAFLERCLPPFEEA